MKKKERPLSPHLSIYKPQITSVMSILHRITGAYLFLGLMIFVWLVIITIYNAFSGNKLDLTIIQTCTIIKLMIAAWSVALFYHLLNGIRHLFWDIGKGYELSTVKKSGIFVFLGTIILTAISMYIVYFV